MNSPLVHARRPPGCPPVGTDLAGLVASRATTVTWCGLVDHLLASLQPVWEVGVSPRKSASAPSALEGTPQRPRHRPPLLT